jgi:HD-GYP domain-containing protein (c-di-GMP phosphodiesterase class II)/DNA-binding CsgD family transcriptional regulator
MPVPIRVAEVFAALSLTTDLATGVPLEEGLATCLVATALSEHAGLDVADRRDVFHASLLRAIGCTSNAPENAEFFGDDIEFQARLKVLDPGDPVVFGAQLAEFGSWQPQRRAELAQRFVELAPTEGPRAAAAGCEVSLALGSRLRLPANAVRALADVHERWDGLGIPDGRRGEQLSVIGRIVHVAEQAVRAWRVGGPPAADAEVARRAGGQLDPELAGLFGRESAAILAAVEGDLLEAVIAAEPGSPLVIAPSQLPDLCVALSVLVDLKGRFLLGHSAHVAGLAESAARLAGLDADTASSLRAAGLLHDLGRAAVPTAIWDRPGPLGPADWERVRLHAYWTGRVLRRCPALAPLAPIAAGHHERLDGSGYHSGSRGADQPMPARLLAAADVLAALTEDRSQRPAFPSSEAGRLLAAEAAAGRLDREAVAAVVEAAGLPRVRLDWPCGLTDREVDVLRLAARGLSNRQIGERLSVSDRTVGHHLAHVYDKIGRRTRAGAAVFAIENGILPG